MRPKIQHIFPPRPDWHAHDLAQITTTAAVTLPKAALLEDVQTYADSLLEKDSVAFADSLRTQSSSHKFLSTIMSSGTQEDKVSALTLAVQESPLHNRKAFASLVALARKKGRSQAMIALAALKDLFSEGTLLPSDRKLRLFGRQPGLLAALSIEKPGDRIEAWVTDGRHGVSNAHLVVWAFEDWLKRSYLDLLHVLESWSSDEVEYTRTRSLTFAWELLKSKPEQEENLLRLLVNKLGDSSRKVASRASHLLLQLQSAHPSMRSNVVEEVAAIMLQPRQSTHAVYFAVITLNQTVLIGNDNVLANRLLELYFNMFLDLLIDQKTANDKKKANVQGKELREKLIAQLLTGVNRAFPYADTEHSTFRSKLESLYRITHSANFGTSIQALSLLQQMLTSYPETADRFYRTLYDSLLDPRLPTSSKQIQCLNLYYRALKADTKPRRVQAFAKRLLQVATNCNSDLSIGILCLVQSLKTTAPSLDLMVTQSEEHDEAHTSTGGQSSEQYDPRKRDPLHCRAENSCLWELIYLQRHFHPTTALYASSFVQPSATLRLPVDDSPGNYTLIHFLDRFAYRNPKLATVADVEAPSRGSSVMQPIIGSKRADMLFNPAGTQSATREAPVNSAAFWDNRMKATSRSSADEEVAFFQNYFHRSKKVLSKRDHRGTSRPEDVGDSDGIEIEDADEDEVLKALTRSEGANEAFQDSENSDFSDEASMSDLASMDWLSDEGEEEGQTASDASVDSPFDDDEESLSSVKVGKLIGRKGENKPNGSDRASKRRKLKQLPTFASQEEYAEYLD